jgi:hypothetical protein
MITKSTAQNILLVFISVCITLLSLELALRIRGGILFRFDSFTAQANPFGRMKYDLRLGWIPRPGRFGSDWTSNVDALGVRYNGRNMAVTGRPILAVGDSFTFGDEVEDDETWPAYLEEILNKRVINAGVGAYGIDQAVLRAEQLLSEYEPNVVILSFISDDITRTELSFYPYGRGWKPYFEIYDGVLSLQNVPVPKTSSTFHRFHNLRRILGYSSLANSVFVRAVPGWWLDLPSHVVAHDNGENVSVELISWLDRLTSERGIQLVVVALAVNGRIGNNARLPNVVRDARANGIQVLDLAMETQSLSREQIQNSFRPNGHYTPEMNAWVADQIASALR